MIQLKDGTGKPVMFWKKSIMNALCGDTNYVSTKDGRFVLVMDEEQDDISFSIDDNFECRSWSATEIRNAVDEFMAIIEIANP